MTLLDRFQSITTFVFDVDGVLTDGSVYIFDDGEQVRRMNIKDGYALQLAIKKGYTILIISGGTSRAVVERLNRLGVKEVFMGTHDKKAVLKQFLRDHRIDKDQVLIMGDDIPDHAAMLEAGLICAPADAVAEIRKISHYVSDKSGGRGCVRDVIERVLKLNGQWELDTDIPSR